jgi:hypothetical protein
MLTNQAFDVTPQRSTPWEEVLFSRRQQPDPHGNADEQIARARQAAEALFSAKPPVEAQVVAAIPPPAVRQPRVLAIVRPVPTHHAPSAATEEPARKPRGLAAGPRVSAHRAPFRAPTSRSQPIRHRVPRAQHARIRTWVEYGMTAAEVAEIYGTPVGEIERILRKTQTDGRDERSKLALGRGTGRR